MSCWLLSIVIGIDYQISVLVLLVKYWFWYFQIWAIQLISGLTMVSDGDGLVLHEASNDLSEEEGKEEEASVPTWDHSNLLRYVIPMTIIHGQCWSFVFQFLNATYFWPEGSNQLADGWSNPDRGTYSELHQLHHSRPDLPVYCSSGDFIVITKSSAIMNMPTPPHKTNNINQSHHSLIDFLNPQCFAHKFRNLNSMIIFSCVVCWQVKRVQRPTSTMTTS